MRNLFIAALAAAASSAGGAQAAVVSLVNADFEDAYVAPYDGAFAAGHERGLPGWAGGSSTGQWNPTAAAFADEAAHGVVGWATGSGLYPTRSPSILTQLVGGQTLQANTRYTLTVDVGNQFYNPGGAFGYDIGLIGGDFGSGSVILASLAGSTDMLGKAIAAGQFGTVQLVFETGSSGAFLGKTFGIGLAGTGKGAAFDNVRLDATPLQVSAVPEPATWAMMITGFGAAGAMVRTRRRREALTLT
jgi:hypothetical protein